MKLNEDDRKEKIASTVAMLRDNPRETVVILELLWAHGWNAGFDAGLEATEG